LLAKLLAGIGSRINIGENNHGLILGNFPESPTEAEENHEKSPTLLAKLLTEIRTGINTGENRHGLMWGTSQNRR